MNQQNQFQRALPFVIGGVIGMVVLLVVISQRNKSGFPCQCQQCEKCVAAVPVVTSDAGAKKSKRRSIRDILVGTPAKDGMPPQPGFLTSTNGLIVLGVIAAAVVANRLFQSQVGQRGQAFASQFARRF